MFHPGNSGFWVEPSFVDASLTDITTFGQFGYLIIGAYDNTAPNCTDCAQWLKWSGWGIGDLEYIHYDRADSAPSHSPATSHVPGSPAIIASRVIPEPESWLSAILGAAIFVGAWSGRKHIHWTRAV
jgi:hypothetical protein